MYRENKDYDAAVRAYTTALTMKPAGVFNEAIEVKWSLSRTLLREEKERTKAAARVKSENGAGAGETAEPSTTTIKVELPRLPLPPTRPSHQYKEVKTRNILRALGHVLFGFLTFVIKAGDLLALFGLGSAYFHRLTLYALDGENVKHWREDQQKEWDRLSTGVRVSPFACNLLDHATLSALLCHRSFSSLYLLLWK